MKRINKHTILEKNTWYEYVSPTGNVNITPKFIENGIKELYEILLLKNISPNQIIFVQFKLKHPSGVFRSISYIQTIKFKEFYELINIFIEYWDIKSEEYYIENWMDILFMLKLYGEGEEINSKIVKAKRKSEINKIYSFKYSGYKLPNTMDFTEWGYFEILNNYNNAIVYKYKSSSMYYIQIFDSYTIVELKVGSKVILTYKDIMSEPGNLSTFTRIINKQTYYFKDGILILKKIKKSLPFLTNLKKSNILSDKFMTMDIETRVINDKMIPYCISLYDGENLKSFYYTSYYNEKFMVQAAVEWLLRRKYHQQRIYLHNFSKFDVTFLLNTLSTYGNKLKPVIRDGRFLNLKLTFDNRYTLNFRDSLLLLPSSLDKLTKSFNVTKKGIFPYNFVNKEGINLDYIGDVPEYSYFNSDLISYPEYIEYSKEYNNNWDLKQETIKYCEQDCISLYQVLDKFSKEIWKRERIDIFKYPTLSSLAFGIYRTNYLNNAKIPLINGELYQTLTESYTGGSVDVYKPRPEQKVKVRRYDVNSLYPYVMKQYPMPVGYPTFFEGDITLIEEKPFGFFEVDVRSPIIKIPLLQLRIKTKSGIRTIAPIGNWTGWYFSEELNNAAKYGYSFTIKRGYLFDKGFIFKDYVSSFYNWKVESKIKNDNVGYLISKLLLNSLYGRFGMNPQMQNHVIVSEKESLKIIRNYNVNEIIDLNNGTFFISYTILEEPSDQVKQQNNSVVISSAVTAYSRIFTSPFKNDQLLYFDTDSIDTTEILDPNLVGNKLGQWKLEHEFDDVVFLAPKVYGGKNDKYEVVKVKGLKNPIPFNELYPLLKKDQLLKLSQQKWHRDLSNNQILLKNEIYTLMVTENKRRLIHNSEDIFIDTEPLMVIDGKIIG